MGSRVKTFNRASPIERSWPFHRTMLSMEGLRLLCVHTVCFCRHFWNHCLSIPEIESSFKVAVSLPFTATAHSDVPRIAKSIILRLIICIYHDVTATRKANQPDSLQLSPLLSSQRWVASSLGMLNTINPFSILR